uniref:Aminoalcoholphosphotransferase n=1 Tax=Salix viminalis TaxID=40686 RepID=A0A6N2N3H8_SALVM
MGYIGSHGIAALHRYKYSGVDHSYVAKYVLQPFWSRCVNFFPLWMPYIHLAWIRLHQDGFILRMDCFYFYIRLLMLLMENKLGGQTRPVHWGSFLTMDVMRLLFESMAFGSTAMCGRDSFWFWLISAVPFYGATWEHFFTNTLILPAVNGPTEGLMLIYVAHFLTALVGAEWWVQRFGMSLPFLSWVPFVSEIPTYRIVLFLMTAFAVIPTVAFNVTNVYKVVQARKGSMLLALAMLYPFLVLVGGVLVWDYLSPSDLMANYPHLVVLGTGLAFGFLVGRMILSHLCDEPKGLKTNMCMSLLYLPFAIANALAARLNDGVALVDEFWVLLGYCWYSICTSPHLSSMKLQQLWEFAASGENLDLPRIVHNLV